MVYELVLFDAKTKPKKNPTDFYQKNNIELHSTHETHYPIIHHKHGYLWMTGWLTDWVNIFGLESNCFVALNVEKTEWNGMHAYSRLIHQDWVDLWSLTRNLCVVRDFHVWSHLAANIAWYILTRCQKVATTNQKEKYQSSIERPYPRPMWIKVNAYEQETAQFA